MDKSEKESISNQNDRDIFDRMKAGEPIRLDDPQYHKVQEVVTRTIQLSTTLNTSTDVNQIREKLSEITGTQLDESTTVFVPFHINFGRFIQIAGLEVSALGFGCMGLEFLLWHRSEQGKCDCITSCSRRERRYFF